MLLIVNNNLVKGGVIVAVLWYHWFNPEIENSRNREKIILTIFGCIIALSIGRLMNNFLPYRARPIGNPEFHFHYLLSDFPGIDKWNSFPSDHAMLFFSLATGVFLISRRWGILSFVYVIIIICLPRIYLGFHHLTDILAGALIGTVITYLVSFSKKMQTCSKNIIVLFEQFPGTAYALFFILSFQIATLFSASRILFNSIVQVIFK